MFNAKVAWPKLVGILWYFVLRLAHPLILVIDSTISGETPLELYA